MQFDFLLINCCIIFRKYCAICYFAYKTAFGARLHNVNVLAGTFRGKGNVVKLVADTKRAKTESFTIFYEQT